MPSLQDDPMWCFEPGLCSVLSRLSVAFQCQGIGMRSITTEVGAKTFVIGVKVVSASIVGTLSDAFFPHQIQDHGACLRACSLMRISLVLFWQLLLP